MTATSRDTRRGDFGNLRSLPKSSAPDDRETHAPPLMGGAVCVSLAVRDSGRRPWQGGLPKSHTHSPAKVLPCILVDTREPLGVDGQLHPWAAFWESNVRLVRQTLPTGDFCLAGNPTIAIERKTGGDLVKCLGAERDRFEAELDRATLLTAFAVVVSCSFENLLRERRGLHINAVVGTLAAWQRRYRIPFFFAGTNALAANFTLRFLAQARPQPTPAPVRDGFALMRAAVENGEAA